MKSVRGSSESSGCSGVLSVMNLVFLHNAAILSLCAQHQCSWLISILNMTADKTACLLILAHLSYIQLSCLPPPTPKKKAPKQSMQWECWVPTVSF